MPSQPSLSSDIQLTVRGWAAIAIAVAAIALAWLFGDRSLNAVAAPALIALLLALVQVVLASEPSVERVVPAPGFPDDDREVTLDIEGGSTILDVHDTLPEGFTAHGNERTVAPPRAISYEITTAVRGVHSIGPLTATVRDVFGLVSREVTVGEADELLVYPHVYSLAERGQLSMLLARARNPEREEFDDLREYVPGDPLRDIHWKSSAKRTNDLIVKEFAGREPDRSISIAASATIHDADQMASAVASIASVLVDAGLVVELSVPGDTLTVGGTHAEKSTMFEMLARVGDGNVDPEDWRTADITISSANGETTVAVGSEVREFEQWRAGSEGTLDSAVAETHTQKEVTAT